MNRRNWIALSLVALVGIVLCTALWLVFVDRDEPPGATGAIPGAEVPTGKPITPTAPGQ